MELSELRKAFEGYEPKPQERQSAVSALARLAQDVLRDAEPVRLRIDEQIRKLARDVLSTPQLCLEGRTPTFRNLLIDLRLQFDNMMVRTSDSLGLSMNAKVFNHREAEVDGQRIILQSVTMNLDSELKQCKGSKAALELLLTHYIDDEGRVFRVHPETFKRLSESRAYYILEEFFKQEAVYAGLLIKGDEEMKAEGLSNLFRERTEILFPQKQEDGSIKEELVKFYHHSPFSEHEVEGLDGQPAPLWSVLGSIELERDSKAQASRVTRQLELLDVYSEGIDFDGKPLTAARVSELPPHIQVYIADKILDPFRVRLIAYVQKLVEESQKDESNNNQESSEHERTTEEAAQERAGV